MQQYEKIPWYRITIGLSGKFVIFIGSEVSIDICHLDLLEDLKLLLANFCTNDSFNWKSSCFRSLKATGTSMTKSSSPSCILISFTETESSPNKNKNESTVGIYIAYVQRQ